VKQHNTKDVW